MQIIVEQWARDPFGLRESCEEFCKNNMPAADCDREAAAADLLHRFLTTVADAATGADGLSVTLVD